MLVPILADAYVRHIHSLCLAIPDQPTIDPSYGRCSHADEQTRTLAGSKTTKANRLDHSFADQLLTFFLSSILVVLREG